MGRLEDYMRRAVERKASDIHFAPGCPAMFRIDGEMIPESDFVLQPEIIDEMLLPILDEGQRETLETLGEVDFAKSIAGFSRVRFNVFKQRNTNAAALRILASSIPDPKSLGIPDAVINLTKLKRGIVLVTGPTGSGKSTTLAALLHIIATSYRKNIITLEDPIEYLHEHDMSMVTQREIGYDSMSYAAALRAALREDPDVILVGEMRDLETIDIALTAAETGHLVFSTLHTNNAAATIDRIIDVFPPHQQSQVKAQLSGAIEGVIAQQLMPRANGGRVAAIEVMLATPAIRNLIREGKSFQIPSTIQTNKKMGMTTMDDAIYALFEAGTIKAETAVAYAIDSNAMQQRVYLY